MLVRQQSRWLPLISLILVLALMQWIGPQVLRYDSRLISEFQLWRLLTGHWVHANWAHFGLNMSGLALCQGLTAVRWSHWQWLSRIVLLSAGVSALFFALQPELGWYVGFSGVLFGLFVMAAVETLREQRLMSTVILAVILLKIIFEQWSSVNITSAQWIGVPVFIDAHLYGVSIAGIILLFRYLINRFVDSQNTGNT